VWGAGGFVEERGAGQLARLCARGRAGGGTAEGGAYCGDSGWVGYSRAGAWERGTR
jgi:hypothetical protein